MASLLQPGPFHILAYGTLLGTTFFHSFLAGIIQFKVLPRPQFAQLQQATFPWFFGMQTLLPAAMALSYPVRTLASLAHSSWDATALLDESRRWSVLLPTAVMFVTGLANYVYIGPETTRVMRVRKHQETRDGKKAYDQGPHSPEMERLNKTFGILHGVSTSVNLIGFGAMVAYGFHLGMRL